MSNIRTVGDFPRNEPGLVDKFLGTAYDTVKKVADNMEELGRLDDVLAEIPTLAQTSVDNALEAELPVFQAEIDTRLTVAVAQVDVHAQEQNDLFDVKVTNAEASLDQKLIQGQELLDDTTYARDQAQASQAEATVQAGLSANSANLAAVSAGTAQAAADQAQTSAKVYPDTATGLAATADGSYFSVPSSDTYEYLILYRRVGAAANEIKRYPSAQIDSLIVNKGKAFPYKQLNRGGTTSNANTTLNNIILGVKVIGDETYISDKYFRVAYIQNGALLSGVAGYAIVVEQFDRATFTSAGTATIINALSDPAPLVSPGQGIVTISITPVSAPLVRLLVTLDTSALPAVGTPVSILTAGTAGWSWVADPSCHIPIVTGGNTLTLNRGRVYPMRRMTRNNITSNESLLFNKIILGVKIRGARAGKYYRVSYFANGNTGIAGAKLDGWIVEEIDQTNYATAANAATVIIGVADATTPTINRDGNVQTVVLNSLTAPGIQVIISLDTGALPAVGTHVRASATTDTGYSYIVDPSCYEPLRDGEYVDSIVINQGKIAPFRSVTRGGVVSATNSLLLNAILGIKVLNAKPGKYYGLKYFQNGNAALVPAADNWIIEEVDIEGYDASTITGANSIATLALAQPALDRTLGIQTVTLNTTTAVRIQLTIDTSKLQTYGTNYSMNSPLWPGYSQVIDPSVYELVAESGGDSGVNSININQGQLAPFRSAQRNNAVSSNAPFQLNAILDVEVLNAKPGKYYGLRYFQNGNTLVVPAADNWIIEEVDIAGYNDSTITTSNSIASLQTTQPTIDRTLGVQTILLVTGSDVRVRVTIDPDKLPAYGTHVAMNATWQAGYSHIIDPAKYISASSGSAQGSSSKVSYTVLPTGAIQLYWQDGTLTRGYEFGPNGANNLPNFSKVLRNGGVLQAFATDWLPPIIFEVTNNGDGYSGLEFTGGNHLVKGVQTAINVGYVLEADGVRLYPGDSGTADRITGRVIDKYMASNTVDLGRYALARSIQLDWMAGVCNVHAHVLALEDIEVYVDYGCQMTTTGSNDTLFYMGGQYDAPIAWDSTANAGSPTLYPKAWASVCASANGQLSAWIDRDYGIAAVPDLIYPGYGTIIGGGGSSTKQYTTAIHKFLQRNPTTPNYYKLLKGQSYKWRGGYSWETPVVADGLVASMHYLDNGVIRRADALSGTVVLKP